MRRISEARTKIVDTFLNARKLAAIEEQAIVRRADYSLFDYADDITSAIWGDMSDVPQWRRDLQGAYLGALQALLRPTDAAAQKAARQRLKDAGYSENYALLAVTAARDTAFPAWAGEAIPELVSRLEDAVETSQDRQMRSHLRQMAAGLRTMLDGTTTMPAADSATVGTNPSTARDGR